jgi:hypothetical protein
MIPLRVVVCDELRQGTPEMALAQQDLERFPLVRSTPSWYFSPGRSDGGVFPRSAQTSAASLG